MPSGVRENGFWGGERDLTLRLGESIVRPIVARLEGASYRRPGRPHVGATVIGDKRRVLAVGAVVVAISLVVSAQAATVADVRLEGNKRLSTPAVLSHVQTLRRRDV